jgi:CRISPR-associated protein Cas2
MRVLVSYDVNTTDAPGRRRLRRVARACQDYGARVQWSVFECSVGDKELVLLRTRLLGIIDVTEDSLRIYRLGDDDAARTEHHGVRKPLDLDGPLVL